MADALKEYTTNFVDVASYKEEKRDIISISPKMDMALKGKHSKGGIPSGTISILSGAEGTGKSSIAMQIGKNAQQQGYEVFYFDLEHRFSNKTLTCVKDIDVSKFHLVTSTEKKLLTGEDFLDILTEVMKQRNTLAIVDSFSNVYGKDAVADGGVNASRRTQSPKLLADWCRRIAPILKVYQGFIVGISHLQDNLSGYGGPKEDIGRFIKHQSDLHIKCMSAPSELKDGDKTIGQCVKWQIKKAPLSNPPGYDVETIIRYGYGIDNTMEMIDLFSDCSIVSKKGAWYSFEYEGKEVKEQGISKLWNYLESNPEVYKELERRYFEFIKEL